MALMQNGYRDRSTGVRYSGLTASNNAYPSIAFSNTNYALRNLTAGEGIETNLAGLPSGYRNEYTWLMPLSPGALSARNNLTGAGAATIAMASGVNGEATLSGVGSLTGTGALIISLVAALTGSGTITNANAIGYLQLAGTLAGAGDLSGALNALGWASAALSGSGAPTSTLRATGALAADITVTGDLLNSANVAAAVWGALATTQNNAGSMGEKVNDAGSAGNPWATVIEAGYTAEELLRIIVAALAGASRGAPDGPIVFTGVDGVTDRIEGDVDADGNRSNVTLDGT